MSIAPSEGGSLSWSDTYKLTLETYHSEPIEKTANPNQEGNALSFPESVVDMASEADSAPIQRT